MRISVVLLGLLVAGVEQGSGQNPGSPDTVAAPVVGVNTPARLGLTRNPERTFFLLPPILLTDFSFGPSAFIGGIRPPMFPTRGVSPFDAKVDLLSSLRLQWQREAAFRPYATMLGAVQLGGVGYALYRHFKKDDPPPRKSTPAGKSR